MVYDTIVEQVKRVPQECLTEVESYIQFVLYRYNQKTEYKKTNDLSAFFGSVNFPKNGLDIQKEMRNEWN